MVSITRGRAFARSQVVFCLKLGSHFRLGYFRVFSGLAFKSWRIGWPNILGSLYFSISVVRMLLVFVLNETRDTSKVMLSLIT